MGVEKVRSVGSCLEREGWDGVEVGVEHIVQEEVVVGWLAYLYALRWERIELAEIHFQCHNKGKNEGRVLDQSVQKTRGLVYERD